MDINGAKKRGGDRVAQWRYPLTIVTLGLLLFETLSGLWVYLLPFSVPGEVLLIEHTVVGLALVILFAIYLYRHWIRYRTYSLNTIKLAGYISWVAVAICAISGLFLTYQAGYTRQIGYSWDLVHTVSTFVILAFLVPHIVLIYLRDRRATAGGADSSSGRSIPESLTRAASITAGLFAVGILLSPVFKPKSLHNEFPPDYTYPYGRSHPFQPSLATTETGGAYDPAIMSGSGNCGQKGCHEDIYKEWSVSAHRWSSMDVAFQGVQNVMAHQNGPDSTRYCGGCHDPISLFSGTKNIFTPHLTGLSGYREGVSCIACHSIDKTDVKGNANYILGQPERYLFQDKTTGAAGWIGRFMIRAYPAQHRRQFNRRILKTPEFCAACHKQFINKQVNHVGWVQLQNQYDNWRKSHWNHPGNPRKTVECRECHMPVVPNESETANSDPGDYNRMPWDNTHRSHRSLGANQFMPVVLAHELPGWKQQVGLTEKWMQGKVPIPEIANKWHTGAAVPIQINAPSEIAPGSPVPLTVIISSNKVGHDYPTGPLDIIQSWLELTVTDSTGRTVYSSGTVDQRHFIDKGSFIFRAEPVDQYGNLIERHNLWEMVGVRYKRSIFPGFTDEAQYSFQCPGTINSAPPMPMQHRYSIPVSSGAVGQLHVHARLRYRKIGQFLVNFVFGEKKGLTCPITDLSTADATINVTGSGAGQAPGAGAIR